MATLLNQVLHSNVKTGDLWKKIDDRRIRCYACGHECPIFEGQAGVCKVRYNEGGQLYIPWGYVAGVNADPIEKKPFFHVKPGSTAFSFGMLGCDLHCAYCQNWVTSQAIRDPQAVATVRNTTPEALVQAALRSRSQAVVSTYNEPLITAEWGIAVFKAAKAAGLMTGFVSNGNATPQVLEYIRPWTDLYKVDLKSFQDREYRKLGGRMQPIIDSIRRIHKMGFWLEIVTLAVPGLNDSSEELRQMAEFIASVSPDIPWHVTAFHEDYKMLDCGSTPVETLLRAGEIGRAAGLRYIYSGNLPGMAGDTENTHCPNCCETLVERRGFRVLRNRLKDGACPKCAAPIPGVW